MSDDRDEGKATGFKIGSDILRLLSKLSEVELEDVELIVGDLEILFQPSVPLISPRSEGVEVGRAKPTELLRSEFQVPRGDYPGQVVEVKLGSTKGEGGSRGSSITIGGERAPALHLFESPVPNPPVISFDVFDKPPRLAKAMRAPYRDVLEDPSEWAEICVDKFGADMVTLHLTSVDPLRMNTPPRQAAETVENVLEAVDVPLGVGGCGDPGKDLKVFERVAEVGEGERLLLNSVTLDMDIERMAEIVKEHGHAVIAFTSMDMASARELNRRLYEFLSKEDIIMDTTTAALGYGLDYAFSIMERTRLAGLMGDEELQQPLASGTTNAWAAREAWMKMDPEWGARELRGPMWEAVTGLTLLLAGVDWFMMMHPAAVKTLKDVIRGLTGRGGGRPEEISAWPSSRI